MADAITTLAGRLAAGEAEQLELIGGVRRAGGVGRPGVAVVRALVELADRDEPECRP